MRVRYIVLLMVATAMVLTGCEGLEQQGNVEYKPIVLTKSQEAIVAQSDAFALDFLRETTKAFPGENVFLSPMSASMLCCMLANGAEGDTYAEIVKAIGMDGFSIDQVNDCYATLVAALLKADRSVSLSLANSIWSANGLDVLASFKQQMTSVYKADSYVVDFAQTATLKRINDWCSEKTKGLIPKMFEELNPMTQMILINALYFKGTWKVQFVKNKTAPGPFTTGEGKQIQVDFMSSSSDAFSGYLDGTVCVLRMPYGNGAFEMEAIMPYDKDFSQFLSGLTPERLASWDVSNTPKTLDVLFPKFKAEFDTEDLLVAIMQTLGMQKAFTYDAEFGKISHTPLFVSNMRQKAYVSVDEEGTEAAAVSEAEMLKNGGGNPMLAFNRPFVYLIREKSTGAILFAGTKLK
jgi:serpin B